MKVVLYFILETVDIFISLWYYTRELDEINMANFTSKLEFYIYKVIRDEMDEMPEDCVLDFIEVTNGTSKNSIS